MRKRRKFASAEAAKTHRELEASWQQLLRAWPEGPQAKKKELANYLGEELKRRTRTPSIASRNSVDPVFVARAAQRLSQEMQEREEIAQRETAKKKKRVAPLFNKGGLQYISDGEDLTTLGRKV